MKPAVVRQKHAAAGSQEGKPLYESCRFVMVRAPLLPVEAYFGLVPDLLEDQRVLCALTVGSPSLVNAIERFRRDGLSRQDTNRMQAKLRRYAIRMSTRPTPYGLFAGVGLATWGTETNLEVMQASTRTRPDMAWLMELVFEAESNPAIRKHLKLTSNPLAVMEGGRVFLSERAPAKGWRRGVPVSLRATSVVKRVLELTRAATVYREVAAALCAETKGATQQKVDRLLTELWEQTLLLTDLRPPLTVDDPAAYVAGKLRPIGAAAEILAKLDGLMSAAAGWDGLPAEEKNVKFKDLLASVGVPADGSKPVPVQTDATISLRGRISEEVAREAERAATLLVRLSPAPRGSPVMAAYRRAFINRYGHEREVNLVELLDGQRGLGSHVGYGYAPTGPEGAKAGQRARVLMKLACNALRERKRVVLLDEETIAQLETGPADERSAPLSLDLNVMIGAESRAALDRGDFSLVIGPNLGAQAGGRNLGRFASLIGAEASNALRELAEAEEERTTDEVWAEVVYLPDNLRMANVTIRPAFREFHVVFGTSPEAGARLVPLDELMVGVESGKMYVRWPAAGKRVRFSQGHMLTHYNAPVMARFLSDLSRDGATTFSSFDWGAAEQLPFLPRVQSGRIVLRLAQWRIHKDTLEASSRDEFRKALEEWRARWDVPQRAYLALADNRLILNLEAEEDIGELLAEVQKLKEGQSLVLQEVAPALEEAWLSGAEGRYYSELVISLLRRPQSGKTAEFARRIDRPAAVGARTRGPGSEWLFAKLYCARDLEDDLIAGPLLTFAERTLEAKLSDGWFFIRYSDPHRHLRVRFRGAPQRLVAHLFGHMCEWASELVERGMLQKLTFDTYERELERFGGSEGMAAAEEFFAVDSLAGARMLRALRSARGLHEKTGWWALDVDDLLDSLGLGAEERVKWLAGRTNARAAEIGADYRKSKTGLRAAVGDPAGFLASIEGGALLAEHLAARRTALAPVAQSLRRLAEEGRLTQSQDKLWGSFVHLHLNRLASGAAASEHRILSLLLRTRESLKQAPILHSRSGKCFE
ncbi:MAG: lantibiotic dehydratase [Bryobacteraceae bacterium]